MFIHAWEAKVFPLEDELQEKPLMVLFSIWEIHLAECVDTNFVFPYYPKQSQHSELLW